MKTFFDLCLKYSHLFIIFAANYVNYGKEYN